jgi:hypothetical protein
MSFAPKVQKDKGVSNPLAKEDDLNTASGQSLTDDRRFTKSSFDFAGFYC